MQPSPNTAAASPPWRNSEVLRRLWTEESVTFEGRYHRLTGVGLAPMPVQRPIPVWFAAASDPGYERAVRHEDVCCCGAVIVDRGGGLVGVSGFDRFVGITEAGGARQARVLPGHIEVVRELLFDGLTDRDVRILGDMMSRARDHMRSLPLRSALTPVSHSL